MTNGRFWFAKHVLGSVYIITFIVMLGITFAFGGPLIARNQALGVTTVVLGAIASMRIAAEVKFRIAAWGELRTKKEKFES